jgi:hypothetical protein
MSGADGTRCRWEVVKRRDGYIARAVKAQFFDGPHETESHSAVAGENSGRTGPGSKELAVGDIKAKISIAYERGVRFDTCFFQACS